MSSSKGGTNAPTISKPALRIPYCTRSLDYARKIIARRIEQLEGVMQLAFVVEGVKRRCYICQGRSIEVRYRRVNVADKLSGLRLKVRQPILVIDGEVLEFKWRGTMFCLEEEELIKSGKCVEVPC